MRRLFLVLVLAAGALTVPGPSNADDPVCPELPGLTENVFTGAISDLWEVDGNWSLGHHPAADPLLQRYVCVPGASTVRMPANAGWEISLQSIHVMSGGSVVLEDGSKLWVRGDRNSVPSTIDAGGRLEVRSAYFGGEGRLDVDGTVVWRGQPKVPGAGGAATFTTRECAAVTDGSMYDAEPCADTTPCMEPTAMSGTPGLIVVGDTGTLRIDRTGVQTCDEYQIDVHGLMVFKGDDAYLAASRGTRIRVLPKVFGPGTGQIRFDGDGAIHEGHRGYPGAEWMTLVNSGEITKVSGAGEANVVSTYSGAGNVVVGRGALRVGNGRSGVAKVAGGSSYGSGSCAVKRYGKRCVVQTTDKDQQNASLTVPRSPSPARVEVQEFADHKRSTLGGPIVVHATSMKASWKRPAIVRLRFDRSLVGARGPKEISIWRKHGALPYAKVPTCRSGGRPPEAGQTACVDLRRNASKVLSDGDVVMVVRATRTSRWVGHRRLQRR